MNASVSVGMARVADTETCSAGRRFFTPGVVVVSAVAALGAVVWAWRMTNGLGATTSLSNAYPWGIWIAIDVACGVALAAGGFTTAFLAHILHRERYHPLVRPALLTAMLGYTFVALGVMTDLGRFWAMWHVMLPTMWQPNSVLFEVAICVMTYLSVLYIEFLPAVCERWVGRVNVPGRLSVLNAPLERLLRSAQAGLGRFMTVFIIMGIMLSCMHQSSLGTLMVIAQGKLHVFWQTPWLPLLFLLSAFAVGFPMVIFESIIAHRSFGLKGEKDVLSDLARFIPMTLGLYFTVKVADLAARGVLCSVFSGGYYGWMLAIELTLGVIVPGVILSSARRRQSTAVLFTASALVIAGVVMNRLNVFLLCYSPLDHAASYVPAWTEVAVTAGFIAMTVLLYRLAAMNLPVIEQLDIARQTRAAVKENTHAAQRAGAVLIAMLLLPALLATSGGMEPAQAAASAPSGGAVTRGTGPEVVMLGQVSQRYSPVRFNHKLHVSMASIGAGCKSCHHTDTIQACRECHEQQSAAIDTERLGLRGAYHRQCLSCHKAWAHENACAFCHSDASALSRMTDRVRSFANVHDFPAAAQTTYVYQTSDARLPVVTFHHADHTGKFGVKCVECHGGSSCGQCHGPRAERPVVSREQSCFACHASTRCVKCHGFAERPRFDHATRANWRLRPGHADLACTACHSREQLRSGDPDRPSSEACKACHATQAGGVFDHSQTGVELEGDHALFGCVECHAGGDDRKRARCTACHESRAVVGHREVGKRLAPMSGGVTQ